MKLIIALICLSSLFYQVVKAENPTEKSSAFVYPELQVSPRASERIAMESKTEAKTRRTQLLPMQVSALATLLAGVSSPKPTDVDKQDRDDVKHSREVAIGVGLAWLGFSVYFNEEYTPYTKANSLLKTMPDKTPQEELVRERIAEENIEAASGLGKKMMWASVVTNLAASAYLGNNTANEGQIYAAAAGLLAFAPIVFRDRWQIVNDYHQEYKKKIYGPITLPTVMTPLSSQAKSDAPIPGVLWQLTF